MKVWNSYENVIRYGKYKDTQNYFCKDCNRKFTSLDTIPKMQYSTDKINKGVYKWTFPE